jgi:uncharacterized membrane protein YbhN (UPF0104 family)
MLALGAALFWIHSGGVQGVSAALSQARPIGLCIAAACFLGSLVASSGVWRVTCSACGTKLGRLDAATRYGVGSLVNSLCPARLGDGVRLGLFAERLTTPGGRALTAGGILGGVAVARGLVYTVLLAVAAALGAVPLWPVLVAAALALSTAVAALLSRRRWPHWGIGRLLDGVSSLVRRPAEAAAVLAWAAAAAACRLVAAAAVAASLQIASPLVAAVIVTVTLGVTGSIPVTPGNVGVTSAAVALALRSRGIQVPQAIACGIAFHAVEMAVGVVFGASSLVALACPRPGTWKPRRVRFALGVGAAAAGAFAASLLPDIA